MSEPKLISPMLDDFAMGAPISDHHGVRCCPAMPNGSDKRYIVKVISIPASQVKLEAFLLTGIYSNETAALEYFKTLADGVVEEVEALNKLSKLEGFLPYEKYQVEPMQGEVGYDVYLLSPYKRSLEKYFRRTPMTHLAAVNLGLDMCASLAVARHTGYLYADLKPSNIFVSDDNEFRVGDIGFMKLDSLSYSSMPERYISKYTAPELHDPMAALNITADVYAAGMILYQAYNGGVLPFEGAAPDGPLEAPLYADYEMTEIIMKAIDPDPTRRWQDPIAMGQSLVSYMQRNGVNNTPIVPPAAIVTDTESEDEDEVEEEPAEDLDQILLEGFDLDALLAEEGAEEPQAAEEEPAEVTEEDVPAEVEEAVEAPAEEADVPADEPAPEAASSNEVPNEISETEEEAEETAEEEDFDNLSFLAEMGEVEGSYDDLSGDASDILSQADDLIAYEPPDPFEALASASSGTGHASEETKVIPIPSPVATADDEEDDDDDDYEPMGQKSGKKLVAILLVLLLLAGIAFGGYVFYTDYYLQQITDMTLTGSEDTLVVSITTDLDHSLLTVICTDTYGTRQESPVIDGKATFTGLNSNTLYKVQVEVSGLRKLEGETTENYTTPAKTEIVNFTAVTGTETGSVILNFTVTGMDTDSWNVTYATEGEEPKTVTFSGHVTTITGLTEGKTYTFTLSSEKALYIVGTEQIEHTVVAPVYAENLAITGCSENKLSVSWNVPEGATVDSWTVRCYNDSGYDETVTATGTSVIFENVDCTKAYTVEVTAAGMSSGDRCYMSANAMTISNIVVTPTNTQSLSLTWDYSVSEPNGQWLVVYTVDGSDQAQIIRTDTNSAVITPYVPGSTYTISIQLTSTTVFGGDTTYQTPEAPKFDGYLITSDKIVFKMCKRPNKNNWSYTNVPDKDYTDTFKVGTKAAFVARLRNKYNTSADVITTMYVIRDKDGKLISSETTGQTWTSMWYKYYGELDIPSIPSVPGDYTIEVYFNGAWVHEQSFKVVE